MTRYVPGIAVAATALFILAAGPIYAEPMKISADLKGSSETPPNDSAGTGTVSGTYDPATKELTWTITYSGLTGPGTMAHFHAPAPAGKAAGVEIAINGSVASPIKGDAKLTDAQAKNLTEGMTYFNVHSEKYPKGEIRGQVMLEK